MARSVRSSDVQLVVGKVGPQYVSLGMEQARDLRGRGVEFNACKAGPVGNALRRQGQDRPVPQPGSRIDPPVNPRRSTPRQSARTMNSGV